MKYKLSTIYQKIKKNSLIVLVLAAIIIRVGYAGYIQLQGSLPIYDASSYDRMGFNIWKYHEYSYEPGIPTVKRSPVYPVFLAGVYFLFKHSYFAVRVVQSLISALTCLVIYLIGSNIFDKKKGFIAFVISVFYPFFIYYTGYLLMETLYTFLISLCIYMTVLIHKKPNVKKLVIYGVLTAITVLCKSSFVIFIPISIVIFLSIWGFKNLISYKMIFVIILFFLLSYSPWIIRNYYTFNRFIPFSTLGGKAMLYGTILFEMEEQDKWHERCNYPVVIEGEKMNDFDRDRYYRKEALKFVRQNPRYMLKTAVIKFIKFWRLYPYVDKTYNYDHSRTLLVIASLISYMPVLVFAIIGMISSAREWKKEIFLYGVIISFMMIHLFFWSQIRYRLPVMPYMIIFAAYGIDFAYNKLKPTVNNR